MVSGASMSSIQNAAIMARVHATASRRAFVTSASYAEDRSRITFDVASYSSKTPIRRARNAFRCRRGSDAMCARIKAPIMVSSGEGGGMSSLSDGGIELRSIVRTPTNRTPRCNTIGTRNTPSRNRGNTDRDRLNHDFIFAASMWPRDEQRPACPPAGAVGPGHDTPRVTGATPLSHGRTAGLEPAASLPCFPVSGRAASQAGGNLVRLPEGFSVAAPSRFLKPAEATVNHLPATEINGDDLGHSSFVLKSPGRPEVQSPCT